MAGILVTERSAEQPVDITGWNLACCCWSVIAIVAHCIPLLTIFALWNVLADGGHLSTVNYSYVIHGVWIAIETISLLITARNHRNGSNLFST